MGINKIVLSTLLLINSYICISQIRTNDSAISKSEPLLGLKRIDSIRHDYFKPWLYIDSTYYNNYHSTRVTELTLEHKNTNTAYLSWNHATSINSFLIEMRFDLDNELFHRKIYHESKIEIPKNQSYTIYPYFNNAIGRPVTKKYIDIPFKTDPYSKFWQIAAIIPLLLSIGTATYYYIEKRQKHNS